MDEPRAQVLEAHGGLENCPETFDGFLFPTRRNVHRRDTDGIANQSFAAITIDIDTITTEPA